MMRKKRGKYNGIGHFTVKYVYSHLRTVMTAVLCGLLTAVVLVLYGIPWRRCGIRGCSAR